MKKDKSKAEKGKRRAALEDLFAEREQQERRIKQALKFYTKKYTEFKNKSLEILDSE